MLRSDEKGLKIPLTLVTSRSVISNLDQYFIKAIGKVGGK